MKIETKKKENETGNKVIKPGKQQSILDYMDCESSSDKPKIKNLNSFLSLNRVSNIPKSKGINEGKTGTLSQTLNFKSIQRKPTKMTPILKTIKSPSKTRTAEKPTKITTKGIGGKMGKSSGISEYMDQIRTESDVSQHKALELRSPEEEVASLPRE